MCLCLHAPCKPPLPLPPAGSPQEEASLVEHVGKLAPSPGTLAEAGQLCELLVLLGHFEDARTLQRELARWMALHQVCGEGVDGLVRVWEGVRAACGEEPAPRQSGGGAPMRSGALCARFLSAGERDLRAYE